ncbi:calcium-binding protein [Corynebacterium stationis]|uniref:HNH endonuclease family protein n=1 Tax=Corynebacterium stationis TaxID=1705 RepID=UPI0009509491|nr:HNH endonuclease family protein [Corynebacterium stationis]APT95730.1 calcium-binding protein [Corynebacterium stationis]
MTKGLKRVATVAVQILILLAIIIGVAFYNDADSRNAQPGSVETFVKTAPATQEATASQPDASNHYVQALDSLRVAGRAPKTGYERELFGQAWSDDVTVEFGHNGCDTRNDILRRDLVNTEIKEGTYGCVVLSGTLHDAYSGETIDFTRGRSTSSEVQIDHIVALADAWQKGAQQWDEETRRNFANDPRNLRAVKGRLNAQKGAGDAATWLPPQRQHRCEYARDIIDVKSEYGLWVTPAEKDALHTQLATCTN